MSEVYDKKINTRPFPYHPGYHPETQSRDDMGFSGWYPGWYGKGHVLISIYISMLYTLFPYHVIFVSFDSYTTGVTSGVVTVWGSYCSDFSILCGILCIIFNPFFWLIVLGPSSIYGFWLCLSYLQTFPLILL